MYKILLIEDEAPARKKLKSFIEKVCDNAVIVAEIETVADTLAFFKSSKEVDIVFSDIELRDGNVFEAFDNLTLKSPIIFSTAYNEFWMNAFETNGIGYLLKPYSFERFAKAWEKFITLKQPANQNYSELLDRLCALVKQEEQNTIEYKEQFAIKSKAGIYFLKVQDIVFFQSDTNVIFAYDCHKQKHVMPQNTLKEIEAFLNPKDFFLINRSEYVNRKFINRLERYNKNVLAVFMNNGQEILKTSQSRTSDFNTWMGI